MSKITTRIEAKKLGAITYFTGKPCPKGHNTLRYTKSSGCLECLRQKNLRKRDARLALPKEAKTCLANSEHKFYGRGTICMPCKQWQQKNYRLAYRLTHSRKEENRKWNGSVAALKAKLKYSKSEKGKRANHNTHLRHTYGITLEEKEQMYADQKGLCILCEKALPSVISACYDHNHITGKGRGLLHKACNSLIGTIEYSPNITKNIGDYLKRGL